MMLLIIFSAIFCILYHLLQTMALYIVSIIVSVVMALVYFYQNKLLYMPMIPDMPLSPKDNPYARFRHPSSHKLQTIDLELKTSDGIIIRGWHVKQQAPQQLIIYFHENAGNIGFRIPLIKSLSQKTNSDVVLVAYRGFSDSQGEPSQQGLQKDANAVLDYSLNYSKQNYNNQLKVFLYGRSLGGAVSIYIGSHQNYKNKIAGLILQNTFTSISDMIDCVMPVFKYVKFLQRNFWLSIERIPKIQKPILFIRSLMDELVPTTQMQRLIKNVDQNVYYQEHTIQNGTHNSSWQLDQDQYFNKVYQFLKHPRIQRNQL